MAHILNSLAKHIPPIAEFLAERSYRNRFETELKLISGAHENDSKHPSIIHFSFNKAATQYVKSVLRRCAFENGIVPVGIHEYAFVSDFPYLDHLSAEEMKEYSHIFKENGYLYSVFGGMIEGIPHLDRYKIILVARDPRDILVSSYYSIAYSHPVPKRTGNKYKDFMSKRINARNSDINEYAISQCNRILGAFMKYQSLLLDKYENVYLTTYEKMTCDFQEWLNDLTRYCELNMSQNLMRSLLNENEWMKPKEENIYEHVRKARPGDYKEKLDPNTIDYLNVKFASILNRYHYKI